MADDLCQYLGTVNKYLQIVYTRAPLDPEKTLAAAVGQAAAFKTRYFAGSVVNCLEWRCFVH